MKTFTVSLTRVYTVTIQAENEDHAKKYTEFYLGNCSDLSQPKDRVEKNFSIEEIEMVYNEANEILTTSVC